jgi:hypothetical protein
MSRKRTRLLVASVACIGIIIMSLRSIHLDPAGTAPPPLAPHSFILEMGLNSWACTMNGNILNCIYRTATRTP